MDIASVLEKYDLDLTTVLSEEGLVRLGKAYNDLLSTLTAETETQQNREKAIRDRLLKDHTAPSESVRFAIATMLDGLGDDFLPSIVEMLQEVKQDLMVLRDFHVSDIARRSKPEKVKDAGETEIRKQEASTLREAIVSVHALMGHPEMNVTEKDGDETVSVFKTKRNAENKIVPDLPRVPGGNTSGNVGRGAKIRQMRFAVDTEDLPAGVLFYDVVRRYCCDFAKGIVVKPTDVKDAIEKNGQSFTPEGVNNCWTFHSETGHTVCGWLPTDENTEESESDSEDS